jgi:[ribosomal protein S18]-alanine N-acetyltransferase
MTVLTVTPYERRHRQAVLDLLYNSYQTHIHLDWFTTEQWLDHFNAPLRLAWQDKALFGVMGCAEPLNDISWLRLVLVRDRVPTRTVLVALWDSMKRELLAQGVRSAWLLVSNDWLLDHASALGFEYNEMVVTLRRRSSDLPPPLHPRRVTIRPAELEDVDALTKIDQTAFSPPWQLARSDLWYALRAAAICTIAVQDGRMLGYQLSTRHRDAGHLARLAVLPQSQGQGVGAALLQHMIETFAARSIRTVTVNTQLSNIRSQRLYQTYYFQRNGYDMPVWKTDLLQNL